MGGRPPITPADPLHLSSACERMLDEGAAVPRTNVAAGADLGVLLVEVAPPVGQRERLAAQSAVYVTDPRGVGVQVQGRDRLERCGDASPRHELCRREPSFAGVAAGRLLWGPRQHPKATECRVEDVGPDLETGRDAP